MDKINDISKIIDKYYCKINMSKYCESCNYNCCRGGIWLCNGEENKIKNNIKIYDNYFIDTFSKITNGDYITLSNNLSCPYYNDNSNKKCIIYNDRPFICRIIPIDVIKKRSNDACIYVWGLRKYCLLYKQNSDNINSIICVLKQMTKQINNYLNKNFLSNFKKICDICELDSSLEFEDEYIFISEINVN